MDNSVMTSFQAAEYCKVTPSTLKNWIKSKGLKAHRTAGGHFRLNKEDLQEFMKYHNIPIPEKEKVIRKRVLIVDDDMLVRETLAKLLRTGTSYLDVATAKDGFDAGIQVSQFDPDILLLDLIMPNIDGFSVCESIKKNPMTQDIKIIVLTGFGSDENVRRAYECGADKVLNKPIKNEKLLKEVASMAK